MFKSRLTIKLDKTYLLFLCLGNNVTVHISDMTLDNSTITVMETNSYGENPKPIKITEHRLELERQLGNYS